MNHYCSSGTAITKGYWDIIKELRCLCANELHWDRANEFEEAKELSSYHLLLCQGDAPLCAARAQLSSSGLIHAESFAITIVIDRLFILPAQRGRKLSKYCLRLLLEEVSGQCTLSSGQSLAPASPHIDINLVLAVPKGSWMHGWCHQKGFQEQPSSVESIALMACSHELSVLMTRLL